MSLEDIIAITVILPAGIWFLKKTIERDRSKNRARKEATVKLIEDEKKEREEKSESAANRKKANEEKLKKAADDLKIKLSEIQEIKVTDVSDYKNILIDNEKIILEKGGDNQLFSFMKMDTFLRDYRGRIILDQSGLNEVLDIEWLGPVIISEGHNLDGQRFDSLFELGDVMKTGLENQIKTMEYYRNMAVAMIVFYLNDKKIRYFEIYEAFEKLGVFDSTWQKNVLGPYDWPSKKNSKLGNIQIRLAQISNQLTELNQNFISLVDSSENIVSELKEINSSIMTNNILQTITAYQTWRINKNTKSLRQ